MVNFGKLAAEILSLAWGTAPPPQISTGFASLQRYCTAYSSWRQPNFTALNRGRHLCSAGRQSRWALAHISSIGINCSSTITLLLFCQHMQKRETKFYNHWKICLIMAKDRKFARHQYHVV